EPATRNFLNTARREPRPPSRFSTAQPRAARDLDRLNGDPAEAAREWVVLPPEAWGHVGTRGRRGGRVGGGFVRIAFPRLVAASTDQVAAAVAAYKREAAVVDARLSREVTVEAKAIALSDLCERLRTDTGIPLEAGRSVADDKVTLFCDKMPL